jgi:O-antigen/teichoic acid export membrane protein
LTTVLQDLVSVFRSKVAVIIFGLGKSIIVARYLGPELNGIITALVVYPTLFMTIGSLGVRKSSAFLLGSNQFNEDEIKKGILHVWLLSVVISVVCIYLLIAYSTNETPNQLLTLLAIAPVPFSLLNTYLSGIYLGRNQIREFNQVDWLPSLVIFASTVVFIVLAEFSLYGALAAELLGPLAMNVILFSKLNIRHYLSFRFNPVLIKALLKLGVAYAISLLILNLNYRVDIVMMDWLSSKFEIGIYSKGAVLTQYLWQVPMLLGTIVFARGSRAVDKQAFSLKVCQLLRVSLILIGLGSLVLVVLARPIVLLLFGEPFLPSMNVMIWLMPGVLLLTVFKVLNMDMSSQGKPWFAMRSMVPALIINVLLNFLWLPTYGSIGAAMASTVSYSVGAILFLFHYQKRTQIPFQKIFAFSRTDFSFLSPYVTRLKEFIR